MSSSIASYSHFLETLPDAVLLVNSVGKIALANSQACALFGYQLEELQDQSIQILVPDTIRKFHTRYVADFLSKPIRRMMGTALGLSGKCKDGSECPVDIMLSPVEMEGNLFIVCVVRDITQIRQMQDGLKQALNHEMELARIDPLTGAANRRHFYDLLQREIERSRRHQDPFTIAYVDLDNFKAVNDQYGHTVGDELLCAVVEYAKSHLRKIDLVARLGGDEFAFLFVETGLKSAQTLIPRIQHDLLVKMQANGWPVTFSIGVLTCIATLHTTDEIIKMADDLMYSAKRKSKNTIKYFVCTELIPNQQKVE